MHPVHGVDTNALITWPAVAVNVIRAFCPGAVIEIGTLVPSSAMVPVISVNAHTERVALPVFAPYGSSFTVYVPDTGNVCRSMNVVVPHALPALTSADPSGFRI